MSIDGINRALALIGKSLTDFPRALDFGCGCGRMLLHLRSVGEKIGLFGVDIDAAAIEWAQLHVPWAKCSVNQGLPPLEFPDEHFDLVFNHSVFTHLDENYQDAWLIELERVTKPGGVLVLSVLGDHGFAQLQKSWLDVNHDPTPLRYTMRTKGLVYIADDSWVNGPFPDFYHSAFHAPWYVFERWGGIFDILAYVVRGDLGFQDLVLLRRRDERVGAMAPLLSTELIRKLESGQDRLEREVHRLEQEVQGHDREVQRLKHDLHKREQEVRGLEEDVHRRDRALDILAREVRRRDGELHRRDQTLNALALDVQEWRAAAEKSTGDLAQVIASRSWRITAPIRNVMTRLRRGL